MLFPPGLLPDNPTLDTKKALLLLDFQHDFVSPHGKLYAPNNSTFLDRLPELASRFRESGPVVWIRTEVREPCSVFSPETGGFCILLKQFIDRPSEAHDECSSNQGPVHTNDADDQVHAENVEPVIEPDLEAFLAADISANQRCCFPGSEGARYPDTLQAAINKKDIVMVKRHYSAFADMSLLFQLRTRMVTNLYICGSLSNISVYATALDAVRHGFGVTVVEDCLGYRDESCHVSAMRQMADNMCVEGIDYQEIMDDLLGLLGDAVDEDSFQTRFEVKLSRPTLAEKRSETARQVSKWMSGLDTASFARSVSEQAEEHPMGEERQEVSYANGRGESGASRSGHHARRPSLVTESINSSPPRKRSTNDLDGDLEVSPHVRLPHSGSIRRSSYNASYNRPESKAKKIKQRTRRTSRPAQQVLDEPQSPALQAAPTVRRTDTAQPQQGPSQETSHKPHYVETDWTSNTHHDKKPKKANAILLGPDDPIGDGTSQVAYNVISPPTADRAFETLRSSEIWQKMYHRSGEVPRLVAVQGDIVTSSIDHSRTYPIYRHPADESPALSPFTPLVDMLRQECEKHVGHTLNHVLIQLYRNSEDNISEHSDKTLDIVRGSNIVNLSLGAARTMTLRSKVKRADNNSTITAGSPGSSQPQPQPQIQTDRPLSPLSPGQPPTLTSAPSRESQRIPLPHASLFILSAPSNAVYLHSIRSDKRRPAEKSPAELAFNGERISLTFRHVGTYITETREGRKLIWGQGASGKRRSDARDVLEICPDVAASRQDHGAGTSAGQMRGPGSGPGPDLDCDGTATAPDGAKVDTLCARRQAERMLGAFGKENHEGASFDWDAVYGGGFDIVNFVTMAAGADVAVGSSTLDGQVVGEAVKMSSDRWV